MIIIVAFIQIVIGAALCAFFIWCLWRLQIWWQDRPLREFLKSMERMIDPDSKISNQTAWQNVLNHYGDYVSKDATLHPEIRKSRVTLIRAIADRAKGVQ